MLNIKPFRQKPGYCGPASLKMILDFFGVTITEKKLAEITGCSMTRGIKAEGLVQAARKLGFHAEIKDFSDLKDIREWVNKRKIPVIVDWFAFEGGHYSVVSGIDKENIYLEDPSLGHRRAMKLSTFKRLWFDFPNDFLRSKNELIIRRMIVIEKSTRYDRFLKTGSLNAELRRLAAARSDIEIKRHRLEHGTSKYDFFRIASKRIKPSDKILLIRAGIHGDEVAGPLTIIKYFNRIFDYAHRRGVKVIIYPLGNPAGFDAKQRYSTDDTTGSGANNDFVLYELENGNVTGDIGRSGKFKRWYWSSDRRLNHDLPPEAAVMHELLKHDPLENIIAALDLHQDHISPFKRAAAYHYAFGELAVYDSIVDAVDQTVPVIANKLISAGQPSGMRTNKKGFIVRHDGTMGDLLNRLGVKYVVAPETTGKTPLDKAIPVNWRWIKGLIDLSAKKRAAVKRSYREDVATPLKLNIRGHKIIETGRVETDSGVHPIYAVVPRDRRKNLPGILLSAGIHGDEPAGVYALLEFINRGIAKHLNHFSFLILPCINPYGFIRGVRFSRDVSDLNRSFDHVSGPPEVAAVKELLRKFPGPYRLAFDFHETDTNMPKGVERSVEKIPSGAYMYETTRTGKPIMGAPILKDLRNSGYPISQRSNIYGAECRNGLIYATGPDHPDYPDLPEFNGTLDWYLLKNGHTDHFLATETPTAWPLKRRVAAHKRALIHALDQIRNDLPK